MVFINKFGIGGIFLFALVLMINIPEANSQEGFSLRNGSAEIVKEGYPADWGFYTAAGKGVWGTSKEAHKGERSVYLRALECSQEGIFHIALIVGDSNGYDGENAYRCQPKKRYEFSFWLKSDFERVVAEVVAWKTELGHRGDRQFIPTSLGEFGGSNSWREYKGTFTAKEDTKRFVLRLYVTGEREDLGKTMWVDDVSIKESKGVQSVKESKGVQGNLSKSNEGWSNTKVRNGKTILTVRKGSQTAVAERTLINFDIGEDPLFYFKIDQVEGEWELWLKSKEEGERPVQLRTQATGIFGYNLRKYFPLKPRPFPLKRTFTLKLCLYGQPGSQLTLDWVKSMYQHYYAKCLDPEGRYFNQKINFTYHDASRFYSKDILQARRAPKKEENLITRENYLSLLGKRVKDREEEVKKSLPSHRDLADYVRRRLSSGGGQACYASWHLASLAIL